MLMTKIEDLDNMRFELHRPQVQTGASIGVKTAVVTLDSPGRYAGCLPVITAITNNDLQAYSSIRTDNILYGSVVSTINIMIHQLDAVDRNVSFQVLVLLKK